MTTMTWQDSTSTWENEDTQEYTMPWLADPEDDEPDDIPDEPDKFDDNDEDDA